MDYKSSEFLTDGEHTYQFNDLNYQNKIKILGLIALEKLSNSLESIAAVQGLTESVDELIADRDALKVTNEQQTAQLLELTINNSDLTSKVNRLEDEKIELHDQVIRMQNANAQQQSQLNNVTARLNNFESLVRQIDTMTDEAVG